MGEPHAAGLSEIIVSHWALCGSDLRGLRTGSVIPRRMGHELSGRLSSGIDAGRVVSIFPIVPCFACRVCSIGDWRKCPDRRTLGFELAGARAGTLTVDTRLVYLHAPEGNGSRACLTEHVACAVHIASDPNVKLLTRQHNVLIVGDGAMAFASAVVLRRLNEANIRLLVKHPDRLLVARTLGINAESFSSRVFIPEDIDFLILACDLGDTKIYSTSTETPLMIAHVARQSSAMGQHYSRPTYLIDSYAYLPSDFSLAVTLIDSPDFDLSYAKEYDEPKICSDSDAASTQLRSLPRSTVKYIFRRSK